MTARKRFTVYGWDLQDLMIAWGALLLIAAIIWAAGTALNAPQTEIGTALVCDTITCQEI